VTAAPFVLAALAAGLLGLAMGSFFTVLVDRWPRGASLVGPRSACDRCARQLGPSELVPVLSWLGQAGRCRGCRARIPARNLAIELASGGLAAAALLTFGPSWRGLAALVLVLALVPIVAIDLREGLIPDAVVLPAAALGLAAAIAAEPSRWWVPVAAAAAAAGSLLLLAVLYPAGMGLGDVKLALLLGAVLGAAVIPALVVAFGAGALVGIALLARHGAGARKMAVPFGPFLAAGGLVALWWGAEMLAWYSERL
jgi:leader peptidase (prepilin peptidase) / N-methyltransferase